MGTHFIYIILCVYIYIYYFIDNIEKNRCIILIDSEYHNIYIFYKYIYIYYIQYIIIYI